MKLLAATSLAAFAALGALLHGSQTQIAVDRARVQAQPIALQSNEVIEAEKAWSGAARLFELTRPEREPTVRSAAARAIGRLEDPRLIPDVIALRNISVSTRGHTIAQLLFGFDPSSDPRLIETATEWMFATAPLPVGSEKALIDAESVIGPLSRIRYPTPEQVHRVEALALGVINFAAHTERHRASYVTATRAMESLFRVNTRVTGMDEETAARLGKIVRRSATNDVDEVRLYALMALLGGRAIDGETIQAALKDTDWEIRRVAMAAVGGAGGGLQEAQRIDALLDGFDDMAPQVRYEAVRGYARAGARTRGCAPLEGALDDRDQHVVLAVLDALGDLCKSDDDLTTRLEAQARVPPPVGSWHRETHAFVALAKRSPERALPSMEGFTAHPVWWVRMYAAGAAAAAGDVIHLEKLVYDANDNVREAALDPWRRLKKADADPAILDALKRMDVQLIRTAATMLKDSPKKDATYRALLDALRRLTTEGKETSRDARLPLLEAIAIHASPENANELEPFLKDFDATVAEKAAQVMIGLNGRPALPNPQPYRRGWPQEFKDPRQCVTVQLSSGGSFRIQMDPALAPIAVDRFLTLAVKDHYYDGLTMHRVVPNFVLQGGSPGANEYSGAKEFMRDEVGGRNSRGTVGLSTRGRNTADAQFFINLVDNPRLNHNYTVFAHILEDDFPVIDKIQEGDVMRAFNPTKCPAPRPR